VLGAEASCALEERGELQIAVAVSARERRPTGGVLLHEIGDHRLAKLTLEIDDVVWKADDGGHATGILQVVQCAARPPCLLAVALIVELHRQTDDVMTLLGEQSRGD
jgi:hypothetical protein